MKRGVWTNGRQCRFNDYLLTLTTTPVYDDFVRNIDADTGENVCIAALSSVLRGDVMVRELTRRALRRAFDRAQGVLV